MMSKEKACKDPIKLPKPKVESPDFLIEKDGLYFIVKVDHSWVTSWAAESRLTFS